MGLSHYPNATIAEFGSISGHAAMQKEIFSRGPIACTIDAGPIEKYQGGIAKGFSLMTDHVVSVVGWGTDADEVRVNPNPHSHPHPHPNPNPNPNQANSGHWSAPLLLPAGVGFHVTHTALDKEVARGLTDGQV